MYRHQTPDPLSRREFMRVAAASAGLFAVGGVLASCERPGGHLHPLPLDPDLARNAPSVEASTARNALRIPGAVAPNGLALECAADTADLGGGRSTAAWMYNGQFPGPTLVARRGERATITLRNQLSQSSITHGHGMLVDHKNDGHPHQAVGSGASGRPVRGTGTRARGASPGAQQGSRDGGGRVRHGTVPSRGGAVRDRCYHDFAKAIAIHELPHPDDLPFLEVAAAAAADALVTGNERHFRPVRGAHVASIRSPTEFVTEFRRSHPAG